MRLPLLAVLALLCAPAAAMAQDGPTDWSRVFLERWCHPDHPCAPRAGLVWNDSNAIPLYPPVMRDVGITGSVLAEFSVRPAGGVDSASVRIASSTNRAFEQLTVDAIRTWRFGGEGAARPTHDVPVRMEVIYTMSSQCSRDPAWQLLRSHGWGRTGAVAQLIVIVPCTVPIPRDQVRPMNPPGT